MHPWMLIFSSLPTFCHGVSLLNSGSIYLILKMRLTLSSGCCSIISKILTRRASLKWDFGSGEVSTVLFAKANSLSGEAARRYFLFLWCWLRHSHFASLPRKVLNLAPRV